MRLVPGLEIGDIKVYIQVPDRAEIVEEPLEGLSGQLQGELEEKLTNRMRMVGEAILKWPRILGPVAWLEEVCSE